MPAESTVRQWIEDDKTADGGFAAQYARAREIGYRTMADEIQEISDDGSNDYMVRTRRDGSTETVVNQEHIQRSRLRVDTRKWLLSKALPKIYGDKVELHGPDGGPLQIKWAEPSDDASQQSTPIGGQNVEPPKT
jgi:hypothetical protein